MKKYTWIMLIAVLLAAPSCSSDSPVENPPIENETPKKEPVSSITAVLPPIKNLSRAEVGQALNGEPNVDFFWSKGDKIALYAEKKYVLDIDPNYDETKNGGKNTAKFSSVIQLSPKIYSALYPADVKVSGDTIIYENLLDEVDFTSAKTPEDKAKIWKSHVDKHILLHAVQTLEGSNAEIKFQPITSIASLTYTNLTGHERSIASIRGFPLNDIVKLNRLDINIGYGFDSEWKPLKTPGLTLAPGESMYFYFHISPYHLGPVGSITIRDEEGWEKASTMMTEVVNEVFDSYTRKGGGYTHVELIETESGLYWNAPDSGIPVTFENKGISKELWDMLGETMVSLNDEGHATMDERDVKNLCEINLYTDNPSDITSLEGLEKFKNLWYFTCSNTDIASIDFNIYPHLANVFVCENVLTELDVSMLTDLQQLYCGNQRNNITLKLKLSEAQKVKWNEEWSKDPLNQNVILVD